MSKKSFVSVDDFTLSEYEALFNDAAKIKRDLDHRRSPYPSRRLNKLRLAWNRASYREVCAGMMMSSVFIEPSTRTSMSHIAAFEMLGGRVTPFDVNASSIAKGESIRRTVQMAAMQRDLVVLRQSGSNIRTQDLANDSSIYPPIINAGEGKGEHPTQALLDMFTIWEEFKGKKDLRDIRIGLYGDLAHGRTAHSLVKLAARMGMGITLIAPREGLDMPGEYMDYARAYSVDIVSTRDIIKAAPTLDVLYTTRLQTERIKQDKLESFPTGSGYGVTPDVLGALKKDAILMHPLPGNDEYPEREMDAEPRARHLQQAENGLWTRAAVMKKLTGGKLMRPAM